MHLSGFELALYGYTHGSILGAPRLHVSMHTCPGALYFCYSCSRLKFARAVNWSVSFPAVVEQRESETAAIASFRSPALRTQAYQKVDHNYEQRRSGRFPMRLDSGGRSIGSTHWGHRGAMAGL